MNYITYENKHGKKLLDFVLLINQELYFSKPSESYLILSALLLMVKSRNSVGQERADAIQDSKDYIMTAKGKMSFPVLYTRVKKWAIAFDNWNGENYINGSIVFNYRKK